MSGAAYLRPALVLGRLGDPLGARRLRNLETNLLGVRRPVVRVTEPATLPVRPAHGVVEVGVHMVGGPERSERSALPVVEAPLIYYRVLLRTLEVRRIVIRSRSGGQKVREAEHDAGGRHQGDDQNAS